MARLTNEQIAQAKRLLDERGELPPEWRWTLFPPEKQECELVYGGKQREEDILAHTMAVPLQNVRTFNNGNGRPAPRQWYNRLIFGDNLQAMKSLLDDSDVKGKVKLVYIDPPFATKRDFQGSQDQKAYQDKVAGAQFIEFLRRRLVFIRDLTAKGATIYVHMDLRTVHYMKVVLDEVFGDHNFLCEIIWKSTSAHSDAKRVGAIHQTILVYTRGEEWTWNTQYVAYADDYKEKYYRYKDADGREWKSTDLTGPGGRGPVYSWKGITRAWRVTKENMRKYEDKGRLFYTTNGIPRLKQYWDEIEHRGGLPAQSIWDDKDVQTVVSWGNEGVGYPTQKSEGLLARILRQSSHKGDLVLDAFAGSGTTCAVAEKLDRRWIGIDCGKLAQYTIQKRMLNLREEIGNKGKRIKTKAFIVQNAGLYDFESLRDLPWEDWRFFALQLFECKDKQHKIGGLALDGEKAGAPVLVFDWKKNPNETISEETIEDIHAMVGKKIGKKFYIIAPMMAFDFFQDYVDVDGVRYYALRIPYTMIQELHSRDFKAVLQVRGESNVNDIQEAYGFSFMIAPDVKWKAKVEKQKDDLFTYAVLETRGFVSKARIKGTEREGGMETLAMLMVDLNYDGEVFDLDKALYGEELEKAKWTVRFSPDEVGERVMAVWIDYHGNEAKVVIAREEFGLPRLKATASVREDAPAYRTKAAAKKKLARKRVK